MKIELGLGPDVVMRLLPHRRPFLMVDAVVAFERGEQPRLWGSRFISANEPVFEGHFPHLSVWPGVYTIEGMGQTSNLLAIISLVEKGLAERGYVEGTFVEGLRNLELSARMHPGFSKERAIELEEILRLAAPTAASRMGMSAAVDVKLLAPVFAGSRLDFEVKLTHVIDQVCRFEVRAEVAGKEVAKGVMKGSFGYGP
jgi:3-hydroxyacyl-[acyl-carrier-protein] dehydratase